jgi:hypothetical protein
VRRLATLLLLAACSTTPRDVRELAGVWESPGGFQYTRLDVAENGEVAWRSIGSLDEFQGRTTATLENGELRLAEPLLEYPGDARRELRYYRRHGREYLVPREHRDLAGESDLFDVDVWWGFRRRLPRQVIEERLAHADDNHERSALLDEWASWPIDRDDLTYLAGVAADDPSPVVRQTALYALEGAGKDEFDHVTDPALHEAAMQAMRMRGLPTGGR